MDIAQMANALLAAVQHGQWPLAAALGLVFVVYTVRKVAPKIHGRVGAWLNSDRGGSALVLIASCSGAFATELIAGKAFSAQLLLNSILAGLGIGALASGARNIAWDIISPADKKPADPKLTAAPPMPPPSLPTAALLIGFLVASMTLSGCDYCKNGANKSTVECKAWALLTKCGPGVAEIAAAEISAFIVNVDAALAELAAKLEPSEYACVTQVLDQAVMAKYGDRSPEYVRLRVALNRHPRSTKALSRKTSGIGDMGAR